MSKGLSKPKERKNTKYLNIRGRAFATRGKRAPRYPKSLLLRKRSYETFAVETEFDNLTEEQSPFKDGEAFSP